jgi:hypothetical protein
VTAVPEGPPEAPRALVVTAAVVLVAGVLMSVVGACLVGVSFDEPYHVMRLSNYYQHGWYLLDDDLSGGEPGAWVSDAYVYGPVTMLVLHAVNRVLGLDPAGLASASASAYAARHVVVALISALGVAAVVATGRMLMRTWAWGLVAGGVLMALPLWTGHAMFNLKDIPVATGYTLVTCGLVLAVGRAGSVRRAGAVYTLVLAGTLLSVGTRPGMWVAVAASVGLLVLFSTDGFRRPREPEARLGAVAAALASAVVVLLLVYPQLYARPQEWLLGAAEQSSGYAGSSSRAYIVVHVLASQPTLLLLVTGLGWLVARRIRRVPRLRRPDAASVRLALVLGHALVMPLLAMLKGAHLYDGLRQLLFVAPGVAILVAYGMRRWLSGGTPRGRVAFTLACVGALVFPTASQALAFPYNYTYASVLLDASSLRPQGDYWRTSFRVYADDVADEFVVCSSQRDVRGYSMRYMHLAGRTAAERSNDCRTDYISPIEQFADYEAADDTVAATFFAITDDPPGPNCVVLRDVTRFRHLGTRTMSVLSRCDLRLTPYDGPITFDVLEDASTEFLLGGWTGTPEDNGVRTIGRTAHLGFETATTGDATLRMDLDRSPDEVLVNNTPASFEIDDGVLTVQVSRAQAAALGEDRVVVTLRSAAPGLTMRELAWELHAPGGGA